MKKKFKILPISDIHSTYDIVDHLKMKFPGVKDIDFICIAGDVLEKNSDFNLTTFRELLDWQPNCKIVFISGNHDYHNYKELIKLAGLQKEVIYLENECQVIDGLKFYGSPLSTPFFNWNYMKEEHEIAQILKMTMDEDIDVALFHAPPYGFGDVVRERFVTNEHLGSHAVLNCVNLFKPRVIFFGHIHSADHSWNTINNVTVGKNVAVLNECYNVDLDNIEIFEYEK